MGQPKLDSLVRIGQLKAEPHNDAECRRMLAMARTHLKDAQLAGASREGRFLSAYAAGHAAALAVLRWHSHRSENRCTVFLCLEHTIGWPPERWRVLDAAHKKRNLTEYAVTARTLLALQGRAANKGARYRRAETGLCGPAGYRLPATKFLSTIAARISTNPMTRSA